MKKIPTFAAICMLMDEKPGAWEYFKPILKLALLVAPGLACGGFGIAEGIADSLGLGVTLMDVMDAVEGAFLPVKKVLGSKKVNYIEKYERTRLANTLLVFSAYFDTIQQESPRFWEVLELDSAEAEWLTSKALEDYRQADMLLGSDGQKIIPKHSDHTKNLVMFYTLLNRRMQNFAAGLKHTADMQLDWSFFPEAAVSHYYKQFMVLCQESEDFRVWNSAHALDSIQNSQNELLDLIYSLRKEIHSHLDLPEKLYLPPLTLLRNQGFIGRQNDIKILRQSILDGENPIVSGPGGIGKTELVAYFGRREYKEGQTYFVRFRKTIRETVTIGIAQGFPDLINRKLDEPDIYKIVMERLRQCGENDILIIDNVDEEGKTFADLTNSVEYNELCNLPMRLLITTRYDVSRSIKLVRLANSDLYGIFRKHGVDLPEQQMDDLISAVDGHTLTIDLIARTLNGGWQPVTPQAILNALQTKTLPKEKYQAVSTDYNRSNEERRIYDHLKIVFSVAGIPDNACTVLRCATLLPQDGLFSELFGEALPTESQNCINTLSKHGWLGINGRKIMIHPVIRIVCLEELKPNDDSCNSFLKNIGCKTNRLHYENQKINQLAELFSNAVEDLPDQFGEWALYAGWFWNELGNYQVALTYNLKALAKQSQILTENDRNLAITYNNIGLTYSTLGNQTEALIYLRKTMSIYEHVLPANHPDCAAVHNNIGQVYGFLGDYTQALEHKLIALEIYKNILPALHPDLATLYSSVGIAYNDCGDFTKSLEYNQKALSIRNEQEPLDYLDIAESYNNIGIVYAALQKHILALTYARKALTIVKKILHNNHPMLSAIYNNIGEICGDLGYNIQAAKYIKKALHIREKTLPEKHPLIAQTYCHLGHVYSNLGNFDTAIYYLKMALDMQKNITPCNHRDLARTYLAIGYAYCIVEDYPHALYYLQKALPITEQAFPESHPDRLQAYDKIGYVYCMLKKYPESQEYTKKALTIRERVLSSNHPDIAWSYNNLGSLNITIGNYPVALQYLQNALVIWEQSLRPNHPRFLSVYLNLGAVYNELGNHDDALHFLIKAIPFLDRGVIQQKKACASHYEMVADTYYNLGNYPQALYYNIKATTILDNNIRVDNLLNSYFYGKIGRIYGKIGDHSKALEYKNKALTLRKALLPYLHPDIAVAYNNVAFTYAQMGNYEKALEHLQIALEIAEQVKEGEQFSITYKQVIEKLVFLISLEKQGIKFPNPFL